jgi:hypothetical protein
MPHNLELGLIFELVLNVAVKLYRGIIHAIATDTPDMVMVFGDSVKPPQAATQFKLLDVSAFRKHFQVAINGSQADSRQALANHLIDLIGAGVRIHLAKFFQNYATLSCHSEVQFV